MSSHIFYDNSSTDLPPRASVPAPLEAAAGGLGLPTAAGANESVSGPDWRSFPEAVAAEAVITYIYPAVVLMGTVGNLLSVLVLTRRPMRRTSVYLYLAVLALADLGVLYVSALRAWVRQIFAVELLHTSRAACKTVMLAFLVSLHMSAWVVVAVTADRFVAVWLPFQAARLCSVRRARLVVVGGGLAIVLYNLHVLFTVDLHDLGYKRHCGPMSGDYFMTAVFPTMKLVSYSLLPFALVLALNAAIVARLWLSRARRVGEATGQARTAQHKVTVMLVVVSITWLVLTAPFTLEPFVRQPTRRGDGRPTARLFLAKATCFLLLYINHAINFYIYCVTGRRFRNQLVEVFRACACCCFRLRRRAATGRRLQSNVETRTSRTHRARGACADSASGSGAGTGRRGARLPGGAVGRGEEGRGGESQRRSGLSSSRWHNGGIEMAPLRKTVAVTYTGKH